MSMSMNTNNKSEKPWQELVMAPLGDFILLELVKPPKIAGKLIEMPEVVSDKFGILKVVAMGPDVPNVTLHGPAGLDAPYHERALAIGTQVYVSKHAGDPVMDQWGNSYLIVQAKEILAIMVANPTPRPLETLPVPVPESGEAN